MIILKWLSFCRSLVGMQLSSRFYWYFGQLTNIFTAHYLWVKLIYLLIHLKGWVKDPKLIRFPKVEKVEWPTSCKTLECPVKRKLIKLLLISEFKMAIFQARPPALANHFVHEFYITKALSTQIFTVIKI